MVCCSVCFGEPANSILFGSFYRLSVSNDLKYDAIRFVVESLCVISLSMC